MDLDARALLADAVARLTAARVPTPDVDAELLLGHLLGLGRGSLQARLITGLSLDETTRDAYDHAIERSGFTPYQWLWGTAMYLTVLGTVLGKAALVSNLWTRYTLLAIPGSLALTLAFLVVFGTVAPALGVSLE